MPWYRDPQWWRDKWPDFLFGFVGAGAGAYVLAILGQIREMAVAYPKALTAFGATLLSVGALVGGSRGRHERSMERLRREEDRKDRQEALERQMEVKRQRDEQRAREWLMELDPDRKLLLLDLSRKGSWVTDYMDPYDFRGFMAPINAGVDSTRVHADWRRYYAYRISLNDFGKLAAQVGMDLLEDVERISQERDDHVAE